MTALGNIKILDLTRFVAGPFCTQLLADMGAEVIKIESPDRGDETRHQGAVVKGESWYFVGLNRNKKSLTLDLKSEGGKGDLPAPGARKPTWSWKISARASCATSGSTMRT